MRPEGGRYVPADGADRLDKPSYDLKSLPRQQGFLHALRGALEAAGLAVEQIDHEDAHGQYELNFGHDEALRSADHLMLFKLAAHHLAEQRGAVFSMMPKPFADQPGSGLHFHVSLWAQDADGAPRALFETAAPERPSASGAAPPETLPDTLRHFVGGLLHHAAALCALAAPTVNSYKRLVVGESLSGTTWAPAVVAHGPDNRTALVRHAARTPRVAAADAAANPYLATAGLIAAGLDGIDRRLEPGPACTDDLFELPSPAPGERGIACLPQSLAEALDALAASALLREALGDAARRVPAPQARRVAGVRAPRQRLGAPALRRGLLAARGAAPRPCSAQYSQKIRCSCLESAPRASATAARIFAFCGLRSCATTQSYWSSGCSALRSTKPSPTREERITCRPWARRLLSLSTA